METEKQGLERVLSMYGISEAEREAFHAFARPIYDVLGGVLTHAHARLLREEPITDDEQSRLGVAKLAMNLLAAAIHDRFGADIRAGAIQQTCLDYPEAQIPAAAPIAPAVRESRARSKPPKPASSVLVVKPAGKAGTKRNRTPAPDRPAP